MGGQMTASRHIASHGMSVISQFSGIMTARLRADNFRSKPLRKPCHDPGEAATLHAAFAHCCRAERVGATRALTTAPA